jgi:fructoselysine-6-P-deglycase FrlB-like protein
LVVNVEAAVNTRLLTLSFLSAAVRLLEEMAPVDVEAAAAAAVASLGGEGEWRAEEMARRKDEAEEEAEDSQDEMVVSRGGGVPLSTL